MRKSACLALFVILTVGCGSGQAQFYRFGGYAPHYQAYRGTGLDLVLEATDLTIRPIVGMGLDLVLGATHLTIRPIGGTVLGTVLEATHLTLG